MDKKNDTKFLIKILLTLYVLSAITFICKAIYGSEPPYINDVVLYVNIINLFIAAVAIIWWISARNKNK